MPKTKRTSKGRLNALPKSPTGIRGLDEITLGGLPQGRPTLICGGPGSGKTLLAMEFLVHGARQYGEPGVFMAFEETAGELVTNVASLGYELNDLIARKQLLIDHVYIERNEIEETGEYDLEGLFVRLGYAVDAVGAKRVVLDTLEVLFSGLRNEGILRAELRRLFRWLKDRGVTAIVTAERGDGALTRHGLEEYVSDCVILLNHQTAEQITTRRMRIVKYRGSEHGTNEYPFLIDHTGLSVLPITSLSLQHSASTERISTGIPRLDAMLDGRGYYRGSTVLVSGTAGTGKTSLAAYFAHAACGRGERCLYFAFEESQSQIVRNMRSIGLDFEPWLKRDLLRFHAVRPTAYGLETHLATVHKLIEAFQPRVVIIDPITNLVVAGNPGEVRAMLARLIDYLKSNQVTALLTSLTAGAVTLEHTDVNVSSLVDTWILMRTIESNGERNRGLYVLKSRGMAHSNQIREFRLTDQGVELVDVYLGPSGVLTGAARMIHEVKERAEMLARQQEVERKRRELEGKSAALRTEIDANTQEIQRLIAQERQYGLILAQDRETLARLRQADAQAINGQKGIRRVKARRDDKARK